MADALKSRSIEKQQRMDKEFEEFKASRKCIVERIESDLEDQFTLFKGIVDHEIEKVRIRSKLVLDCAAKQYQFEMTYLEHIRNAKEKTKLAQDRVLNLKDLSRLSKLQVQHHKDINRIKNDAKLTKDQFMKSLQDEYFQVLRPKCEEILGQEFDRIAENNGVKMQIVEGRVEIGVGEEVTVVRFDERREKWVLVSGVPAANQIIEEFNIHNSVHLLLGSLKYLMEQRNGGSVYF